MKLEEQRAKIILEIMKNQKYQNGIRLKDLYILIKNHDDFEKVFGPANINNPKQYRSSTRRLLQNKDPSMTWYSGKDKMFQHLSNGLWTYYGNPLFTNDDKLQHEIFHIQEEIFYKIEFIQQNRDLSNNEKQALIKTRINQTKFKDLLIKEMRANNQSSPIRKIDQPNLLIATHIIDYQDCEDEWSKGNYHNGLILSPDVDKLFELKYLSFHHQTGKILIKNISQDILTKLKINHYDFLPSFFLNEARKDFLKQRNQKYGFY